MQFKARWLQAKRTWVAGCPPAQASTQTNCTSHAPDLAMNLALIPIQL